MASTIIAPASGTSRAGIIVIRISGQNAIPLIEAISNKPAPDARIATLRKIYDLDGSLIDNALILLFKSPNSFTGEDVVEIHIHGGPSVLSACLNACLKTGLVEFAKPGEFTKRAFHNNKLDLTQCEGLADLIDAETEAQRKQAIKQMEGGLKEISNQWRSEIIDCMAEAEAYLDFPDEDLPSGLSINAKKKIESLIQSLQAQILLSKSAQLVRDGTQFVIIGAPNVGKSSILNAIAGRDAAIVSSIAGTTRDIVEISLIIKGNLVSIADTAGLRETIDIIEIEGVKRALERSKKADIIIGVATDKENLDLILPHLRNSDILLWNKSDIYEERTLKFKHDIDLVEIDISTKNIDSVVKLLKIIGDKVEIISNQSDNGVLTRLRHIDAVEKTVNYLQNSLACFDDTPEIICENLRMASRSLSELVGVVDLDEVYDRIFSSFCIGK